jgi:hypothetical protein
MDFTIGDEPFKDRFANMSRFNVTVSMYHSWSNAWGARAWLWARRSVGGVARQFCRLRSTATAFAFR